jgi:2-haloacid dehalogenase
MTNPAGIQAAADSPASGSLDLTELCKDHDVIDFQQVDAISFDCYGTLIDWETGITGALRPILTAHGVHIDDRELLEYYAECEAAEERKKYRPYREVLRSVVQQFGRRYDFEPADNELSGLADSLGDWPPFSDTVGSLNALKAKYRLAIISNVDHDLLSATLRRLDTRFDHIITSESAKVYKPSRRMFSHALKMMRLPKEKILHVAQSLYHDIVPAGALGLKTVWVNRRAGLQGQGATPPAEAHPDLEVPDLGTLASLMMPPP